MRIRVLGQHLHSAIAVLSMVEASMFFVAVCVAVLERFHADPAPLTDVQTFPGAIRPSATLFSGSTVTCILALGLYSPRQRARLAGTALRVMIALVTRLAITGTLFYIVPALWMGRGVVTLAAIGGLCGVMLARVVISRVVDEQVFKRWVLVYGAGESAAAEKRGESLEHADPSERLPVRGPPQRISVDCAWAHTAQ